MVAVVEEGERITTVVDVQGPEQVCLHISLRENARIEPGKDGNYWFRRI